MRYKLGRNLNYPAKEVFEIKEPKRFFLPMPNLSTAYIFALGSRFFAYPNNYNYYVQYYRNTFQHGGISMEEMIIPHHLPPQGPIVHTRSPLRTTPPD